MAIRRPTARQIQEKDESTDNDHRRRPERGWRTRADSGKHRFRCCHHPGKPPESFPAAGCGRNAYGNARVTDERRHRVRAQPDGCCQCGLGPANGVTRPVHAGSRQPGERPQRATFQRTVESAGSPHAGVRSVIAGHLGLLAERHQTRLSGRALSVQPDDAKFHARSTRTWLAASTDCGRRSGDDEGRSRGV